MNTVIVVDDHPLVREALEMMLSSEKMKSLGSAAGAEEAIALCRRLGWPDLVVSDVRMADGTGFEMLARMKRLNPDVKVLLLAGMPLKVEVERAREMGAAGYLPKSMPTGQLVGEIRRILEGGPFAEEKIVERKGLLTEREMEVLHYLRIGKTREEIGIILGIGTETVKSHLRSIMKKLDVSSSIGIIGRAYELGILRA